MGITVNMTQPIDLVQINTNRKTKIFRKAVKRMLAVLSAFQRSDLNLDLQGQVEVETLYRTLEDFVHDHQPTSQPDL